MAKVFIEETTLTAIGDAIRGKEGTADLVPVNDMATRITNLPSGGGDIEVEPIVLTGDCSYSCSGKLAAAFIKTFPDKISTEGISNLTYMFNSSSLTEIPFVINVSKAQKLHNVFYAASKLEVCPKIRGTIDCTYTALTFNNILDSVTSLRDVEDLFTGDMLEDLAVAKYTSAYSTVQAGNMFTNMRSLRHLPTWLSKFRFSAESTAYPANNRTFYYSGFQSCYALDEILDLPVLNCAAAQTSTMFNATVNYCGRLKRFTFETVDGQPIVTSWKNQVIDCSTYAGWTLKAADILNYNSGITADKEVKDDATYQALKNDPDWFTTKVDYSRYNHNSAVETINSLPDTSAYLASAGGTNTIKFKGAAGSATDGGAINTLTEEEIAVAAAKGWTVTLS